MNPGREMDALVAEKVFGYTHFTYRHLYNKTTLKDDIMWFCGDGLEKPLPYYSTDIAAAWDVVEKFKHLEPEIRWDDENRGWYLNFTKKELGILPYGSTAPHAICLAALRAWGVKYEE